MKTQITKQQWLETFGDGQTWHTSDGTEMADWARSNGVAIEHIRRMPSADDGTRFVLADGEVLAFGDAWDFRHQSCGCGECWESELECTGAAK